MEHKVRDAKCTGNTFSKGDFNASCTFSKGDFAFLYIFSKGDSCRFSLLVVKRIVEV